MVGGLLLFVLVPAGPRARPVVKGRPAGPRTVTTTTLAPAGGPYAVGTAAVNLVEPATGGLPARVLPTSVRYPAQGIPGGPETAMAPPSRDNGPYPLVVFSQGYDVAAEAYAGLLEHWASAGYVVVDPTYPFTDPASAGGVDERDIANHPGDLRFVISSILQASASPSGLLSGLIAQKEVAVVEHSDGGDVTLATAVNSCCRDARITAAVILSGAELASFGGTYYASGGVPLMVVQGTADNVNPAACSIELYNGAPPPKVYLSLLGAEHGPPYLGAGPDESVVATTTTDFLNGYLKGWSQGRAALATDGSVPGVADLSAPPSLGTPAGTCPGAPGD